MFKTESGSKLKKRTIFGKIFADNSYCWLACLCTTGLMLLVYYCYDLFPFGDMTILRMDMYHQYGPLFAELYDRVTNLESFIYSWRTGLGSPFLGNFFNYLSSPSAIIILLLGHKNMPESIAGMILVKAALSAATFTYYLKKSQKRHDFTTAAFGILYSMCGYFIAYYWNVMWIDAMVYFPLVILGIERVINKRKPACYIVALAATLLSNYYMGYMVCIFSVLYFLVYFFANHELLSVADSVPFTLKENGKKKYKFTDLITGNVLLRSGLTFTFSSIAAAGLVAFALLPTYFILKNCSATSGTFPEDFKSYFSIFDFLANHLASVVPTIRSSGADVLPNVYCGIATVMLVPLYLFTKSISVKEKVAHVALLGVLFLSFNNNALNYIWHGFHFPNDLPYRFSFMYSFILLILAYKAFTRLNEFSGRAILGSGLGVLGAIILIEELGSKNVEENTVIISIIFVVTYCLVFALMKDSKYQQSAVSVLLLCCIIGEIACANTDRYSMNQSKANFTGDYQDFVELKEDLDEHDDSDMYRMELMTLRARMDPAWYGYNGASTFSSMAYEKLSNVQSDLGMFGNYINSYTYHMQTPVYNMMHSLKYVVDNSAELSVDGDYFTKLMTQGKYTAYENNYHLPIGFAVDKDLKQWYTQYNNPFIVQGDWFEYSTGVSGVYQMMNIDEIYYYNFNEIVSGLDTGDIYFSKPTSDSGEANFYLSVPETRHCYLYVNSYAFDQITITKNGTVYVQNVNEPYIYDLGIVQPEDDVSVLITIDNNDYGYMDFYPFYVDDAALNEGYEILKKGQLNVTSFEETCIKGTVSLDKNSLFFTSIPYDTGWKVKIDGKEIDKDDYYALADAYLCFNISAGEHEIEISYKQQGLVEGILISVGTLVALIAVYVLSIFIKKRKAVKAHLEQLRADAEAAEWAKTQPGALTETENEGPIEIEEIKTDDGEEEFVHSEESSCEEEAVNSEDGAEKNCDVSEPIPEAALADEEEKEEDSAETE